MRGGGLWLLLLCGCGRIGFDARADASADAIEPAVPGPQVWYRFEDPPGAAVIDSSGHGHDGHCTAPLCPELVAGRVGSAYDFSGGEYVAAPGTGELEADTAVTIAAWVFIRSTANQSVASKPLAYQMNCCYETWQLEIDLGGALCASGPDKRCSTQLVKLGTWQHFAATWDGTTKQLYIDGALVMTWPAQLLLDGHDIVVGADYNLNADGSFQQVVIPTDGVIDEVLIYDRVLTGAEIATLASQ